MPSSPDVVVVGAGVVGAACAYHLAAAGVRVRLLERSFVASGSSGACEGNVLAWDKELERELPLALRSAELWETLAGQLPDDFEYDRKGSIVVAETEAEMLASAERARVLAGLGVHGEVLDAHALRREEPHSAHDLPGGVLYPGDAQLEPRLATAALVKAAVRHGAELSTDTQIIRIVREPSGRAIGVETVDRPDHRRRRRGRRGRVDEGAARGLRPARAGHAAQGPDRRARALAGPLPPQALRGRLRRRRRGRRRRAADRDGRRVDAVRHRAARLQPPAPRLRPRASTSASPARSPAAPRASSRSSTTPARCASTPGCAR